MNSGPRFQNLGGCHSVDHYWPELVHFWSTEEKGVPEHGGCQRDPPAIQELLPHLVALRMNCTALLFLCVTLGGSTLLGPAQILKAGWDLSCILLDNSGLGGSACLDC